MRFLFKLVEMNKYEKGDSCGRARRDAGAKRIAGSGRRRGYG